jgi:hypothetical protein
VVKRRSAVHKGPLGTERPRLSDDRQIAPAYGRAKWHARFNFAEKSDSRCPSCIKQRACGLATGTKKTPKPGS